MVGPDINFRALFLAYGYTRWYEKDFWGNIISGNEIVLYDVRKSLVRDVCTRARTSYDDVVECDDLATTK
jgi:hypothetical protein